MRLVFYIFALSGIYQTLIQSGKLPDEQKEQLKEFLDSLDQDFPDDSGETKELIDDINSWYNAMTPKKKVNQSIVLLWLKALEKEYKTDEALLRSQIHEKYAKPKLAKPKPLQTEERSTLYQMIDELQGSVPDEKEYWDELENFFKEGIYPFEKQISDSAKAKLENLVKRKLLDYEGNQTKAQLMETYAQQELLDNPLNKEEMEEFKNLLKSRRWTIPIEENDWKNLVNALRRLIVLPGNTNIPNTLRRLQHLTLRLYNQPATSPQREILAAEAAIQPLMLYEWNELTKAINQSGWKIPSNPDGWDDVIEAITNNEIYTKHETREKEQPKLFRYAIRALHQAITEFEERQKSMGKVSMPIYVSSKSESTSSRMPVIATAPPSGLQLPIKSHPQDETTTSNPRGIKRRSTLLPSEVLHPTLSPKPIKIRDVQSAKLHNLDKRKGIYFEGDKLANLTKRLKEERKEIQTTIN